MENFPNLMREKSYTNPGNTESQSRGTQKRHSSRHIIIKVSTFQDKERILKSSREKQEVTHKGALIRLAADFSMEMLQPRKEWQEIFQVRKT